MSYNNPVTPEVLANLSPDMQKELKIWQKNHCKIWDAAFHLPNDCPFGYTLTYLFTFNKKTVKWARYIYLFYQTSHKREGHCTCDAEAKL